MTQEHPITPPPELIQQWLGEYFGTTVTGEISDVEHVLATRAARWGADQELEACCEWLEDPDLNVDTYKLRTARQRKLPSFKQLALEILDDIDAHLGAVHYNILRRALETLSDD